MRVSLLTFLFQSPAAGTAQSFPFSDAHLCTFSHAPYTHMFSRSLSLSHTLSQIPTHTLIHAYHARTQVAPLNGQLAANAAKTATTEAQTVEVNADIKKVEAQIVEVNADIKKVEARIVEVNADIKKVEAQVVEIVAEIKVLEAKEQLSSVQQGKLTRLIRDKEVLDNKEKDLRDKEKRLDSEKKDLRDKEKNLLNGKIFGKSHTFIVYGSHC